VLISANLKFDCVLEHKASVRDGSSFRWKLGIPELDKDKRKMFANCLDIPPKHRDSGFQLRVKEFDPFSTMVLSCFICQNWRLGQFQQELGRSSSCRVTACGFERFQHISG
jgi:hypothetical protein